MEFQKTTRRSPMCRAIVIFAAVLSVLTAFSLTAVAQSNDPLTFNWNEYGKQVAAGMPRSIRDPVERIKFVADAVGSKLKQQGITPNVSLVGRGISGVTFGDLTLGTCDDVSEALRDALYGAGMNAEDVLLQVSIRQNPIQGTGLDLVNMSHASLVVFIEKKPYVFDLWMHGATTGEFSGFSKSVWSALDPAAYLAALMKWGYSQFYCHNCTDRNKRSGEDFLAALYARMILEQAREEQMKQIAKGKPEQPQSDNTTTPSMRDTPDTFAGKKTCAALMQAISKEKESEDAVWGKYWVVFTRPYTYENGFCVGAHQIWRKKVDGSPPYAEVEFASPEKPARIPISEINRTWKVKFPQFDWGR